MQRARSDPTAGNAAAAAAAARTATTAAGTAATAVRPGSPLQPAPQPAAPLQTQPALQRRGIPLAPAPAPLPAIAPEAATATDTSEGPPGSAAPAPQLAGLDAAADAAIVAVSASCQVLLADTRVYKHSQLACLMRGGGPHCSA